MVNFVLNFAQQFSKEFTSACILASDKDMFVANAWWSIVRMQY
jgi:hypothetical protein